MMCQSSEEGLALAPPRLPWRHGLFSSVGHSLPTLGSLVKALYCTVQSVLFTHVLLCKGHGVVGKEGWATYRKGSWRLRGLEERLPLDGTAVLALAEALAPLPCTGASLWGLRRRV